MFKTRHISCDLAIEYLDDMEIKLKTVVRVSKLLQEPEIDTAISELLLQIVKIESLIENTGLLHKKITGDVQVGEITVCCTRCAEKYREKDPYDGTYNIRTGHCQICEQITEVTSAFKLFGYHRFL